MSTRQGDGTGYCIGTWDMAAQAYLPHPLHLHSWYGLTLWQLRQRMRDLQECGYTCHRYRDPNGEHYDNDTSVLIAATNGRTKAQVIKDWKRTIMAKKIDSTLLTSVDEDAEKLITAIRSNEGSFDDVFRASLAKHLFSRYMRDDAPEDTLAQLVAERINEEFEFTGEAELSVEWYENEASTRTIELIEAQQETCQEIELAKASLEAANDRKKLAQSTIDESNTRLRNLARELKKPYIYPLPPAPSRQRELPLGDGEEWRVVPLSEVLKDEAALKATVLEKLGNITLGKYAEEAQKFGLGDKPKKLTRKQWDKVEAIVQRWHEEQKDEDDEDDGDDE